jgi:hypothetical protein
MTTITKQEKELLDYIAEADHSSDGYGLGGYVYEEDFDMKKLRGVLASLIKKGIVTMEKMDINWEEYTWVSVTSEYQVENPNNTWSGYDLCNLEVK